MIEEFEGFPVKVRRKAFMRRLSMHIFMNGTIKITAGKLVSAKQILKFLNEHKNWISKVQSENLELRQKYPPKHFVEGELFPYLGGQIPLRSVKGRYKVLKFIFFADHLRCEIPQGKNYQYEDYRRALLRCYEKAGRRWLSCRVEFWAQKMNSFPQKVSVRSQKTRWGSCSSEGHISLNWRLLAAPLPVLDYVVIHELAHLTHQNHSNKFWMLVEQFDSRYKYNRNWLRKNQWAFDFLAKKSELHHETY